MKRHGGRDSQHKGMGDLPPVLFVSHPEGHPAKVIEDDAGSNVYHELQEETEEEARYCNFSRVSPLPGKKPTE